VWQAHKQHFYQRAHQGGLRHDEVVLRIMATNLVLVPLALFSLWAAALPFAPWLALVAAVAAVGGLLAHLGRRRSG
jgi:hypothetical protein